VSGRGAVPVPSMTVPLVIRIGCVPMVLPSDADVRASSEV
jgi:hypothetical protein